MILQRLVHLGQYIFHERLTVFAHLGLASLIQDLAFAVLALRPLVDDVNVGQDRAGHVKPRVFHAVLEELGHDDRDVLADLDDDFIMDLHQREDRVLELWMKHHVLPERLQGHLENVRGRTLNERIEDVALADPGVGAERFAGVGVIDPVKAIPVTQAPRERDTPRPDALTVPQVAQVDHGGHDHLVLVEEGVAQRFSDRELQQVQEGEGHCTLAVH